MNASEAIKSVYIYARSAHRNTSIEPNSVHLQVKMLRQYAFEMGYVVLGEFVDDGVSGVTFNRPALVELIKAITKNTVDISL